MGWQHHLCFPDDDRFVLPDDLGADPRHEDQHRPEDGGRRCQRYRWGDGGGPKGARNGAYRDGLHTAEAVEERRALVG
jgi:hypothetical protein